MEDRRVADAPHRFSFVMSLQIRPVRGLSNSFRNDFLLLPTHNLYFQETTSPSAGWWGLPGGGYGQTGMIIALVP